MSDLYYCSMRVDGQQFVGSKEEIEEIIQDWINNPHAVEQERISCGRLVKICAERAMSTPNGVVLHGDDSVSIWGLDSGCALSDYFELNMDDPALTFFRCAPRNISVRIGDEQ